MYFILCVVKDKVWKLKVEHISPEFSLSTKTWNAVGIKYEHMKSEAKHQSEQWGSKMLLIVCLLFCDCFHFFSITMIVYNNTSWCIMYTSILWPNILVTSPNCNILFLMFPFPNRCQSGFSQSCILVSKKYLREPSLS